MLTDDHILKLAKSNLPSELEFCSLRWVNKRSENIDVKKDILQPIQRGHDAGVMVSVIHEGGIGYAATSDISDSGIQKALEQAKQWAALSSKYNDFKYLAEHLAAEKGAFESRQSVPVSSISLSDRIDALKGEAAKLKISDEIVNWGGFIHQEEVDTLFVSNRGAELRQKRFNIFPNLWATAFANGESQTRRLAGAGRALQGGWEHVEKHYLGQAKTIADQAIQLVHAEDCPSTSLDLLLMPDQMMLQIHESIGHPLELDRILGDERNYAGTSFVTADMIGSYQYGSDLLNVSFDPTIPSQLASYAYDDDGTPATKQLLIENGILKQVLGGSISQARANLPGVANSRAQSWNRPPLDRMANLNIEPGESSLDDMIASVENGILMEANRSWSIDDSRNKFQFGCEWGQLIKNGRLDKVVKNPNYRGVSRSFWRSLSAVGKEQDVFGTPWCGKAEPNQIISVGHASPPCLFKAVDVFGG